jgi:hypothetical protein
MMRTRSLAATVAAATLLLGVPAMAAGKHPSSCYDYAWESQDMRDCLEGKGPQHDRGSMHKQGQMHGQKHGMTNHRPMHEMHDMPRHDDMPMKDMPMNKS